MNFVSDIYQKNKKILASYVFPGVLLLYPFFTINQGVDVSDSLYSLTNFRFFPSREGMWIISTYLSNMVGYLFTRLPYGTTVLGMKVYTGLVLSGIALTAYGFFKRWMPDWIAFMGEIIALSYCWIPTTILYNYLTYFFLTLGTLLLYKGLVEEKNPLLIMAGAALGVNVWVRIPNVMEISLIFGLWYYLTVKKRNKNEMMKKTGYCILGYFSGAVLPLMVILLHYGFSGLVEMIRDLGKVGNQDSTYSLGGMVFATLKAYGQSAKWAFLVSLGIFMGTAVFFCLKEKWQQLQKAAYLLGILVLFRFFWGRGMFTFRYYEDYTSIYEWGMLGLYLSWMGAIILLRSTKSSTEEKLWVVLAMILLAVTPLGSNNYTYQNLNNLFFVAPVGVYTYVKLLRRKGKTKLLDQISFPWKAMVLALGGMILMQGIGFHGNFVFRDGMGGEKRDYKFQSPRVVAGMRTTRENGQELQQVLGRLEQIPENKIILWGDCPGISFLSGKEPAIHTAWPDLESESYEKIKDQIMTMKEQPVVVIREKEYHTEWEKEKKKLIEDYIRENKYTLIFESETYRILKKL